MFDCSVCSSFCCIVPPMLEGEEELKKAKEYGVRIISTKINKHDKGYYVSVTKNHHNICPFVSERGCRIYDNRFKVCREFSCNAKEKSIAEIKGLDPVRFYDALSISSFDIARPQSYSYEILKQYDVEIVGKEEAIELVNISSLFQMYAHMDKIQKKIGGYAHV